MMKNSEFFYDPMRAAYDGGADYFTKEKHWLVVIANDAVGGLRNIARNYNKISAEQKFPFSEQEIDDDVKKLLQLKVKFKSIKEVRCEDVKERWEYPFSYEQGIKELDDILLKYIPFFEEVEEAYKK